MKTLTLPKGSPDPLPELATFLEPFARLFRRTTSRKSLERYVTGLLTDLPRKICEAIAQTVANTSLEQLQHLLTDAAWDPVALDEQRVRSLIERSPKKGVLVLDEVGVQHHYCGALGKQGSCQVVVSAEYVVDDPSTSRPLHWPISARLYLPESWTEDRSRCQRCHVPETVSFATKPELALQLVDRARTWGVPFHTIVTDAGYGIPSFLRVLDERHLSYVCAVASDFGVRLPAEMDQARAEPSSWTRATQKAAPSPALRCEHNHGGPTRRGLADRHLARRKPGSLAQAVCGHPRSRWDRLCPS